MRSLKTILLPLVTTLAVLLLAGCGRQTGGTSTSGATAAQAAPQSQPAPVVEVVPVVQQKLERTIRLPGELSPWETVAVYPKVTGFVEWIGVDRGSRVGRGQSLARMTAPELVSQRAEAEARLQAVRAQRAEAAAKLAADEGTYQRLKAASATPGVVAGNDVEVADKVVSAGRGRVSALDSTERAAQRPCGRSSRWKRT